MIDPNTVYIGEYERLAKELAIELLRKVRTCQDVEDRMRTARQIYEELVNTLDTLEDEPID